MDVATSLATNKVEDEQPVVIKHHLFVRIAHWLNLPTISFLILSGLSIYWASPIFTFGSGDDKKDLFEIIGEVAMKILPGQTGSAKNWFVNHFGLGSGQLAYALNIHWLFAYIFMAIAVLYWVGLLLSGEYRALLPRKTDFKEGLAMVRYYLQVVPFFLLKKSNPHPHIVSKYNALQRAAYLSVSIFGALSILTGWAIHKPAQLGWLQAAFGGYDLARVWHFLLMLTFIAFVVPHVTLVIADGWDCFRSMVVGWSDRIRE